MTIYLTSNFFRYYNAGEKPVTYILNSHPELIHRVNGLLDSDPLTAGLIYHKTNYNWRRLDAIHLLTSWRSRGGEYHIFIFFKI